MTSERPGKKCHISTDPCAAGTTEAHLVEYAHDIQVPKEELHIRQTFLGRLDRRQLVVRFELLEDFPPFSCFAMDTIIEARV